VYWADLLSRESNRGALDGSTLPTLIWQPLLCRRVGLLRAGEYPGALVAAWLAVLLPASLLAYPLTLGARFFAQVADPKRRARIEARTKGLSFLQRARALADAEAYDDTLVEEALESIVADVPNYMRSVAGGEGVAFDVLARFHDAMRAAQEQCGETHVLAHSLGTVVAYHALTGLARPDGAAPYSLRRLYTIGSPLEKVRFFWPWTVRETSPSADPDFRWTNFYHAMDAVSGRLRRFEAWAKLDNVRLKGGGGMLRSHVVYEQSPQFLGLLTEDLFQKRRVPPLTTGQKLKDRALTAAENLAGPAALLASLALGLSVIAIVLLFGPYVFSLPLRWLGMDVWAWRAGLGLALLVLTGMTLNLVLEMRRCYRHACADVTHAATASSRQEAAGAGA
jgi:hypothetical protein